MEQQGDWLGTLYGYLDKRAMPETAATVLAGRRGAYGPGELVTLNRAVRAHSPWWVSSMGEDYERGPDCSRPLTAALAVWKAQRAGLNPASPADMQALVDDLGSGVGWCWGMDWKADRLPRSDRRIVTEARPWPALDGLGKRQYNRRVRVLRNLEDHARRMEAAQAKRRLILISRSGFACDIPEARFRADPEAAAFISYFTARKNKRRMFSLGGKENPFDHIAEMLLRRCWARQGTDWEMIAGVYPAPEILGQLPDGLRGSLMGRWWNVMQDTAAQLGEVWVTLGAVKRETMIVRAGMDSSSWNELAGAYNASRAAWISLVTASGAQAVLDAACPGKVMRLMAADLAYWHQSSGGDVDPNTAVWSSLPMPWDVISGAARCTREDVAAACSRAGLDPGQSGWTGPRATGAVAAFTPTPELVHGVDVADPSWAALLRRAGVFSGKSIRQDMAGEAVAGLMSGVVTGRLPGYAPASGDGA